MRAQNGHDRAIRLLETQHNTSFTYVEKDKCLITELTQKAEEALERAKTMYSDAAAKFYYEKSRCERTTLAFLCRWLQNCQKRVTAAEHLKEAAEKRVQVQFKLERRLSVTHRKLSCPYIRNVHVKGQESIRR